ncbi:hypothetical protein ABE488_00830 [Luteimonas sp. TWI662]|uniref:hypothetical protein n=1 Tax=Luteimonas sp. TWI662 TaxID=3136789 RepID=UPI00320822A6
MRQLSITFEKGIAERSRTLREHMAVRVYGRGLVETAGRLDLSPSKLTEKLAGSDSGGKPRGMTIDELETYIQRTGDVSPVHYLVEKFLGDPEVARDEALAKLASMVEQLAPLMAAAGLNPAARKRR